MDKSTTDVHELVAEVTRAFSIDPGKISEKLLKLGAAATNPVPCVERPDARRDVRVKLTPAMSLSEMASKYIEEFAPDGLDERRLKELTKQFLTEDES